jgi:hypothetical protein
MANEGADPVFEQVMKAIRTGKNPDHQRIKKLDAAKRREVEKALRKRKGKHTQGFRDDVIDTGMFDS